MRIGIIIFPPWLKDRKLSCARLPGPVATGCPSCGGGGEKLTSLTDAAGSKTNFAYELRGLLTSVTDPLQKITSLTYDVNGRATSRTDRNGTTLACAYTPTGMLASITYPDSSQTTNTYDSLDRLTQLNDSIGTSSFSYDADGRITSFTDADGFTLAYVYDAAGNITQVTYPDASTVTYAYDSANRLTTVTDWLGGQATYAYDQDGRLATFTQFNGIVTTYSYDAASRLTGMGSAVASCQFTLDGNGNRVNSLENQPLTPAYSLGSTTYEYNAQQDRLLSAGPLSYAYDNEGQLVNSGGACLTFDYNRRLVEVGSDTQFSYDGRGSRLSATRAGVTTHYVYDPWGNLVADADSNGVTHKYIYGNGLLAVATSTGRYCYHFNGIGSTVAITDMNQNIVNSYAYDPFGQILSQQETIPQPFKYVGQYGVMAEPNGLYYMRARYYDPSVGRFISEDPIGFAGGDVNLFAYVLNNPVNSTDPGGLAPNDKTYGLPKDFWNWYHRNIKKPGDPDLSKEEAEVYYKEWKALGQPGPDHKGKSRCEGMPEYNPYAPYFPYDPFFLPIMPLPFNPSLPSIPEIGPLPFPIEPLPVVP